MKQTLLVATGLLVAFCSCCQDITSQLDTLMTAYAKNQKFNGSVLVSKNGAIVLNKGYGLRDAATGVRNNEQSVYQIGSVTKQFTSTIILKLQDEKKLSVKDKLSKYFPQFPHGDSITIEQLLSHTSGVYSYTANRQFMSTEVSKSHSRSEMLALFQDKPLDFTPGSRWQYSNSGYLLLGYIIEDITKKSYEQVVREYIFKPVHMTNSGFDFTHLKRSEKSTGYFVLNDVDTVKAPIVDSTVAFSAGSIYSTTGDLYRWHKALENYTILSKPLQEKAFTPIRNKYGYGWGIDSVYGKRLVSHSGGIHGFSSNFARIPEDDVVVILLSNNSSPVLSEITLKIFAALYGKPYEIPRERKAIVLGEEKLKEYVGEYVINPDLHLVISIKNGNLLAEPTGQSPAVILPEKEDFFFVKQPDVQLQFKRNDKNEVTHFVLFQNGGEVECKKIK